MTVTVGQLSGKIFSMIRGEKTFEYICVKGEISNYSPNARSGHIYFTLKDERAAIRAVMFRGNASQLKIKPEDGMAVVVRGNVSCYEAGGYYQIIVSDITEDGAGEQAVEFEKLKAKLEAEGLFSRKRPLLETALPPRLFTCPQIGHVSQIASFPRLTSASAPSTSTVCPKRSSTRSTP